MPVRRFVREPSNLLLRKAVGNSTCIKTLRNYERRRHYYQTKINQMKREIRHLSELLQDEMSKYDMLADLSLSEETLKANVRALKKEKAQLEYDIRQLRKRF